MDELKKKEFLPYSNAIAQGLDFIMVGHISVPNVTGDDTPASLSEKMISEVLRQDLGFKGIVMTDYLNDRTIVKNYSAADAAVKAIQAGLIFCLNRMIWMQPTKAYSRQLRKVISQRIVWMNPFTEFSE